MTVTSGCQLKWVCVCVCEEGIRFKKQNDCYDLICTSTMHSGLIPKVLFFSVCHGVKVISNHLWSFMKS